MRRVLAVSVTAFLIFSTGCAGLSHTSTNVATTTGINTASINSVSGLSLSLSLDAMTYQPGQTIAITLDEINTLPKTNSVNSADNWPFTGLSDGPCGTLNYSFGVAIYQGYDTAGDISSLTPLSLNDPAARYPCPMMLSQISTYQFQPSGDTAAVFQLGSVTPALTEKMTAAIQPGGYWTGNPTAALTDFAPGIYTVAAGDEWGAMVILHFTVTQ
jgi:hypothetical protein